MKSLLKSLPSPLIPCLETKTQKMGKLLKEVSKITMDVEALSPNPNFKSDDDDEGTTKEV